MGSGPLMVLLFFGYLSLANLGSVTDAYIYYWGMDVKPPWVPIIEVVRRLVGGVATLTEVNNLIALIIIAVLGCIASRLLPVRFQWYMWPTLVLILLRYYPLTLLNGTMRYVLDFFPIFLVMGVMLSRHVYRRLVWIIITGIVQALFLYLFVRWLWIA
jgi:hypothetical protein